MSAEFNYHSDDSSALTGTKDFPSSTHWHDEVFCVPSQPGEEAQPAEDEQTVKNAEESKTRTSDPFFQPPTIEHRATPVAPYRGLNEFFREDVLKNTPPFRSPNELGLRYRGSSTRELLKNIGRDSVPQYEMPRGFFEFWRDDMRKNSQKVGPYFPPKERGLHDYWRDDMRESLKRDLPSKSSPQGLHEFWRNDMRESLMKDSPRQSTPQGLHEFWLQDTLENLRVSPPKGTGTYQGIHQFWRDDVLENLKKGAPELPRKDANQALGEILRFDFRSR